jgi:hypothetical protein
MSTARAACDRRAAISEEEAELILRTRIDGADLHALADAAGRAYHTVKVRPLRAEKRLLLSSATRL